MPVWFHKVKCNVYILYKMMNTFMIMAPLVLENLLWLPLIVGSIRKKRDERRCQGYTIGVAVCADMHTEKLRQGKS